MLKDKIKSLTNIKEKDSKKKIENLVVFVVILIITIIVINKIWTGKKVENNKINLNNTALVDIETQDSTKISSVYEKNELEEKLENILNKIEGVGNVRVMITYSQTSQTMAMYNENNSQSNTEEEDTRRWNKKNK